MSWRNVIESVRRLLWGSDHQEGEGEGEEEGEMEVSSLSDGEEWASAESQDTDPGDAGANKTVEDR